MRRPSAICDEPVIDDTTGRVTVYVSFSRNASTNTRDLSVYIEEASNGLSVSADLVEGEVGTIISELPPLLMVDTDSTGYMKEFISAQKEVIVEELDKRR